MHATTRALSFALVLLLPALARAQEPAPDDVIERLQKTIEKVIQGAEPSVACILVSRSDAYRRWDSDSSSPETGKLGAFDCQAALRSLTQEDHKRKREIRALDLSDPATVPESYGSGVVVDAAGLILTPAHVIRNATKIYVRLPGGKGSWADIHAADPRSDLAILRLISKVPGLKPLRLGDGSKVHKGQFVITITNPFAPGFRADSPSASWGLVRNLRRRAPGNLSEMERSRITLHHYGTLIQTDTRIAPGDRKNTDPQGSLGCSGGALLSLKGEMIGLTTCQAALSGGETPNSFAIPMTPPVHRIIDVLKRGEEVEYGFLGVRLHAPGERPGLRLGGVRIASVVEGTPAYKAGLGRGDYIVRINDDPIRDNDDLFLFVGIHLAGTRIRIETAARTPDGPRQAHEATLTKFYVPGSVIASHRPPAPRGLRVDWTSLVSQRNDLGGFGRIAPDGVLVREVVPNSPADKAQLQADSIITKVGDDRVTTPAQFYARMEQARGKVKLTVLNGAGHSREVTVEEK